MNTLETVIQKLKKPKEKKLQVQILQEINTLILAQYLFKIDDDFVLYPIEIEAYYYSSSFQDDTVHRSELQKNRFGKFYFHRKGHDAQNKILFFRSGLDVCLSDSEEYFFGILIRSARINDEERIISGPQLLAQRVYKHICNDENMSYLSKENMDLLANFERDKLALKASDNKNSPILIHSSRIGLNKDSKYYTLEIRSLTDLSISKQKEKDVLSYMKYNNISPTPQHLKKILGYSSNWILEQLKTKII